jgi:hypothetical protein
VLSDQRRRLRDEAAQKEARDAEDDARGRRRRGLDEDDP